MNTRKTYLSFEICLLICSRPLVSMQPMSINSLRFNFKLYNAISGRNCCTCKYMHRSIHCLLPPPFIFLASSHKFDAWCLPAAKLTFCCYTRNIKLSYSIIRPQLCPSCLCCVVHLDDSLKEKLLGVRSQPLLHPRWALLAPAVCTI